MDEPLAVDKDIRCPPIPIREKLATNSFHDLLSSTLDERRLQLSRTRPTNDDRLPSLSYLQYRKILKKTKRKMKRRIQAVTLDQEEREKRKKAAEEGGDDNDDDNEEAINEQDELDEIERKLREHEAWLEREREAKREFEKKEEEEKRRAEEELRREADANDKSLRLDEAAIRSASSSRFPPKAPPPTDLTDPNNCEFYMRTGACRFGETCKRLHPEIEVGTKVLIPRMFESPALQTLFSTPEGDVTLDQPVDDVLESFKEFFEDVLPEFRKIGDVKRFKVCSNRVKHLRGNVYVEYEREEEAFVAAQVFGGRWYAGRQLSARVTVVRSWRQAVCLQYLQKCCPKGMYCNYLHCFVNPADDRLKVGETDDEDAVEKRDNDDSKERVNGATSGDKPPPRRTDGRLPPRWKRSPSPLGKHRPFRSRDHYVDDDRIWKKDKEKKRRDEEEAVEKARGEATRPWDERHGGGGGKNLRERRRSGSHDVDGEDDFCERSRKRHRREKERRRRRSPSRGSSSSGDDGSGRSSARSSSSSSCSSDEMGKKILKATLKSIKNKKSKKKSKHSTSSSSSSSKKKKKKSKKSKKKRKKSRSGDESTDSSWESGASDD